MRQIIPLQSVNQTLNMTLNIDDTTLDIDLEIRWNDAARYWGMKISDPTSGDVLIDAIPLLRGDYFASNILEQYAYLNIGAAYLMKVGNVPYDNPTKDNLGIDFLLLWRDTPT